MSLDNMSDLLEEQLQDLYNAENQLAKALPKMAKKASNPDLKSAFEEHLDQTEGHVDRLEQIFDQFGKKPSGKTCAAMKGLVEEGQEIMSEDMEEDTMDAALIAAAQKIEHYEIASYGTVRTWAKMLGEKEITNLLQETLDEEGQTDKLLTKLAVSSINLEAERAN